MTIQTDPDVLVLGVDIILDTAAKTVEVVSGTNLDSDGLTGQCLFSFLKIEWRTNPGSLFNFKLPFRCIDPFAEAFEMWDWRFLNDSSRLLVRNAGWQELDYNRNVLQEWAGILTGPASASAFEDPNNDTVYRSFGLDFTDISANAAVDFSRSGPVNEAVKIFEEIEGPDPTPTTAVDYTTSTITRNDGGDWVADGVKVGAEIVIRDSILGNDGTYNVSDVTASVITVVETLSAANNDTGAVIGFSYRNRISLYLRERDADPNGKTFAYDTSELNGYDRLGPRVHHFHIQNAVDVNIDETDANIDGNAPFTGMTISWYNTPQTVPVGGVNYDWGVIIDANNGTKQQVYEFVQRTLRRQADVNAAAGGSVVNGELAPELLEFSGDCLVTIFQDTNPGGAGGGGVLIQNVAPADQQDVILVDNTGAEVRFPFIPSGLICFDENAQNDPAPPLYAMFFEYTDRFTDTDVSVSGATGNSALVNSTNIDLSVIGSGDYFRLSGFSGALENLNGIWQATAAGTANSVAAAKPNGDTVFNATSGPTINVDINPVDSPDAIIVDDNSGTDITGSVAGESVAFDFDYDNNVQGGRTAGTDAAVVVRVIGESVAQEGEVRGTLTRNANLKFQVATALERCFLNP